MTAEVTVQIMCDGPNCVAFRQTRTATATADNARLTAINNGWAYREGNDYCPEHVRLAR